MPIRLNLLAEAQAEEEMRRRDPVKRSLWVAGMLVCCVLLYSAGLFIATYIKNAELHRIEARMDENNTQYKKLADNQKRLADNRHNLEALRMMAGKRFLWGTLLNALQKTALDEVQLVHFRADQSYAASEEVKGHTTDSGRTTIGRPGFVTERVTLTFDAKDNSSTPGDHINKYKTALETAPFLGKAGTSTNGSGAKITLKNLSAPGFDAESGKTAVLFSLECHLPDRIIK